MPVSKKDLSNKISLKLNLSKKDSLSLTNSFFNFLISKSEKHISIHGFGSFFSKIAPQRVGRNPKTMEEFIIRKRQKFVFRGSESIKKSLN